jgi:hypothetical protein
LPKELDAKVERLEKLIKKLSCYDENNRLPKKKEYAYKKFAKLNWNHPAFKDLESLSRRCAIGMVWSNQKRNTKEQKMIP